MSTTYRRRHRNANGKLVRARKCTVKFRDASGVWRELPGFTDEKASAEFVRKLERLASLRASGEQPDPTLAKWLEGLPMKLRDKLARWGVLDVRAVAGSKPLAQHLADYKQALLDGVASPKQTGPATLKHAETVVKRVQTLLDGIGARFLSDVRAENVGRYLAERRTQQAANSKKRERLSVQTSNHWLTNAKSFFNWLVRSKRGSENPIAGVAKIQVTDKTRKLKRRALEHDEGAALLEAARTGPVRYGMPGLERYWLYRLALETALRSGELRRLTSASFELDGPEPFVWLSGDDTKNRKGAELPLRPGRGRSFACFLMENTTQHQCSRTCPRTTMWPQCFAETCESRIFPTKPTRDGWTSTVYGSPVSRGWRTQVRRYVPCRNSPGTRRRPSP